jgi:hypothetical protein
VRVQGFESSCYSAFSSLESSSTGRERALVGLKGLSHEIDFKSFDKNLQNLAYLRDAAGF